MADYLHTANGLMNADFAWSITAKSTSASAEAAAESAWAAGMVALFGDATFGAFLPADTELTETSTSTASATWHQTTKTTTTHSTSGTSASPAIAYGSATIVTLRTALATRYGRGRWYLPGLATNALAANGYYYSAAAMTALANAVTAAFAAWSSTLAIQIMHPHGAAGGTIAPYSITPVTSGDVSDAIARQARRADKRVPIRTAFTA